MPLKRCQKDNKLGWKWGDSGKCYIGPSAKEDAERQGRAIESQKRDEFYKNVTKLLNHGRTTKEKKRS